MENKRSKEPKEPFLYRLLKFITSSKHYTTNEDVKYLLKGKKPSTKEDEK